jgi:S1-C subfamily serine protease
VGSELPSAAGLSFDMDSFTKIPELTDLNSRVLPVLVVSTTMLACVGTAFLIAPGGVAVTARHVIDEALVRVDQQPGAYVAVLWVGSGTDVDDVRDLLGGLIGVYQRAVDGNKSDLALLRISTVFRQGEFYPLPTLALSSRLPQRGNMICALGYTKFDVESDTTTQTERLVTIAQDLHYSSGRITDVYPDGRDATMLPTACFETSARFDPGMSGGPVLGEDGTVCGVVASGMAHDDGYTSFASATPFVFTLGIKDDDRLVRVYEMAKQGNVQTDDYFSHMRFNERPDGNVDLAFAGDED